MPDVWTRLRTDPAATFTVDEVVKVMATALRWGYEARVGEENEAAVWEPRVLHFGRWYDQAVERERADAEMRRLIAERNQRISGK